MIVIGPKPLPVTVDNLRDAISKDRDKETNPEPGKEPKKEPGLLDALAGASAGHSQSGSNLAGFVRRIRDVGGKARRKLKRVWGTPAKSAAGSASAARSAGSRKPGTAGSPVAPPAGKMSGGLGAVGTSVSALGVFTTAVVEAGKATYAYARSQEQEIRRLASVGGQQAAAVATLDARRTMRDVKTAAETGDSSQGLVSAIDRFEQVMQPIEALVTNIANTVGGAMMDTITGVIDAITPVVKVLTDIYNAMPGRKIQPPETMWEAMGRFADEVDRQERPQFPQGPVGGADFPF